MKIVRLSIQNFRGIKPAELLFDGHTLMMGSNNVSKNMPCEDLDLDDDAFALGKNMADLGQNEGGLQ
jgi:predicted ATPase